MSQALIHTKFNLHEMIQLINEMDEQLPFYKKIANHLLEIIEVANLKLDLLIKTNQEIDGLISSLNIQSDFKSLEYLCERSKELFQEIEHLPIMREERNNLLALLKIPHLGTRYAQLLDLLYTYNDLLIIKTNPYIDIAYLHAK